jgi:hypothetical protein
MVKHDVLVRGVRISGKHETHPVILQMHDDDFPARFLTDLAASGRNPISSAQCVDQAQPSQYPPVLFQPVQRMVHLAMVELNCETAGCPRLDPKRVVSAGLVIRKVNGKNSGGGPNATNSVSAWMRTPTGQYQWLPLTAQQQCLDPDPTKRPQLYSGQAELDRQLAAISLATAYAEVFTPAFVAQPDICTALRRTVAYALIPTASSEVSDASTPGVPNPAPPAYDTTELKATLPVLLQAGSHSSSSLSPPVSPQTVDYRWLSDDFVRQHYPGDSASVSQFQNFSTALRMLHNVFGAFDTPDSTIVQVLNRHHVYNVTLDPTPGQGPPPTPVAVMKMGDFYQQAKTILLDYNGYGPSAQSTPPNLTMPTSWDGFSQGDETALLTALVTALTPRAQQTLMAQGRYQNRNSQYQLRVFFRIKGETAACPPELVWSAYSEPFRIAAWYESGNRPHPPVPLPDPTSDFLKNAKPNCSFHVPGALMGAIQGTSMSGLMSGGGGGPALTLDWICSFNIPLITICAFLVLNIFLSLLNIVFFWMAFIKICIPFPASPGED